MPDALKAFVDEQVVVGHYSSVSEYVREDGLHSGAPMDASPEFWADARRDVAA